MTTKILTRDLTSYDLLKTFAVLMMIIDHVGCFLFPDEDWLRVLGRLCVPVWFFLIGYANTREIPTKFVVGAFLVVCAGFISGLPVFPVNVLFTLMLCRLLVDRVMSFSLKSKVRLWSVFAVLVLLIFPSYLMTDYGTHGLILAMFGYLVRWSGQDEQRKKLVFQYMIASIMVFGVFQQLAHGFDTTQFAVMVVGILVVHMVLLNFRMRTWRKPEGLLPASAFGLVQICGRYTLEIYVIHLIILNVAAVIFGVSGFAFLQWTWWAPDLFE